MHTCMHAHIYAHMHTHMGAATKYTRKVELDQVRWKEYSAWECEVVEVRGVVRIC